MVKPHLSGYAHEVSYVHDCAYPILANSRSLLPAISRTLAIVDYQFGNRGVDVNIAPHKSAVLILLS